jgi:hypothetical protein
MAEAQKVGKKYTVTVSKAAAQQGAKTKAEMAAGLRGPDGRLLRSRKGAANTEVVGGLTMIISQVIVQVIENDALQAYESGDSTRPGYAAGKMLADAHSSQEYYKQVILGRDPEVEGLPWWEQLLRKWTASMTLCHDGGAFMH